MTRILIDAVYPQEIRVAEISKSGKVLNFDYESATRKQLKGNIYLAKVTRVEPSLQAAFIEYGQDKQGFLPFAEIQTDYYQIPTDDKKKLEQLQEEIEAAHNPEKDSKEAKTKSSSNSRLKKISEVAENNNSDHDDLDESSLQALKKKLTQKYKIQEVIKKNQLILVQVIKEERGNKGVSLSTYISLAGRYCVLMPNSGSRSGGISRRIDNISDRKRLRELIKGFNIPKGTSLILRTAVQGKTDQAIEKDYNYLVNLWNNIRQETLNSSAPALVYHEADAIKRAIRDLYEESVEEIIIEGSDAVNRAKKLVKAIDNSALKKIKEHKSKNTLFKHYKIEEQIDSFYQTNASLESGGYIVINITEALISIDVNSGRATKERSVEETALNTNLEAAKEVARQIRLRDLSGLIVVDFIDMLELENRKALERELRSAFADDKAKIQISRVSNFGLIEMSRQRLKPSLIETNTDPCPACNGTGFIKSYSAFSIDIFRAIRFEVIKRSSRVVKVYGAANAIAFITNFRRNNINILEQENNIKLFLYVDHKLASYEFRVESEKNIADEEQENLDNDKTYNITKDRTKNIDSGDAKKTVAEKNLMKKIFKKLSS
ncbi:MAG: Rne/Rng family ribonuclease [Rickettsiales bacterium]|nr:Rne/Rng family ribonuclease [Rickettsiales bacterium]